jgi:hypothetical protein
MYCVPFKSLYDLKWKSYLLNKHIHKKLMIVFIKDDSLSHWLESRGFFMSFSWA